MYLFVKQYAHAVMTDSDDAHALQCRPNYHLSKVQYFECIRELVCRERERERGRGLSHERSMDAGRLA